MRISFIQRGFQAMGLLLWLAAVISGQAPAAEPKAPAPPVRKPLTIATTPRPFTSQWQGPQSKNVEIQGQLVFAVTKATDDDKLKGTMIYGLSDEMRARLAKQFEQPLKEVPAYLIKTEVGASWSKGASCPYLRIETDEVVFEIFRGQIHFKSVKLEFAETQDYLPQLFCHWTRQLNTQRQRRSIIAAINRALSGGEPE